jgi:hypothetical protein
LEGSRSAILGDVLKLAWRKIIVTSPFGIQDSGDRRDDWRVEVQVWLLLEMEGRRERCVRRTAAGLRHAANSATIAP